MKRLLIGLASLVALTGCGGAVVAESPQTPEREQRAAPSAPAAPAPASNPVRPNRLQLEGIDAPVVPLDMSGTTLTPPDDPTTLGWWGRKAGARHGVTLLVGHTVHTGGGALDDLEDVQVGSTATVSGVRYRVTSDEVISKSALAERAAHLFDQTRKPRLVLVTCEGYDPATGHYDSNVVLTAEPV
jgi:Sortase domain